MTVIQNTLQKSHTFLEKEVSENYDLAKYVPSFESNRAHLGYFKAESEQQQPSNKDQIKKNNSKSNKWQDISSIENMSSNE